MIREIFRGAIGAAFFYKSILLSDLKFAFIGFIVATLCAFVATILFTASDRTAQRSTFLNRDWWNLFGSFLLIASVITIPIGLILDALWMVIKTLI